MTVSLLEAAKLHATNGDMRKAGLVMAFAQSTPLLSALPILTMVAGSGSAYSWTEEGVLPTAAWRALNASYTAGEGKSTPRAEHLKIAGGTIQIDRAIIQTMGESQRNAHILTKTKATSQLIGYGLIHGDPLTDKSQVNGLTNRFPLAGSRSVLNTGGAGMSMKSLDEAIDETSNPTHLLMNRATVRNMGAYLRGSGTAVQMGVDEFGRRRPMYNDLPIIIADPVDVDSAYRSLPFTEGSSQCSAFVLSLGLDALHLVEGSSGMQVEDIGTNDAGTLRGNLIEWLVALADEGPRCVTRLQDITNVIAIA